MPTPETAGITLPHGRSLTVGEIALVESVFGGTLDTSRVSLHRAKYWMLQPVWTVMAPNGRIWFHPGGDCWREDFATAALNMRALFIHEMVHVWQHQTGPSLLLRRWPFARYHYALVPGKPFAHYGIEQQACIVEDAYVAREAGKPNLDAYAPVIPFGRWA